jgi:hypothetical protein
MKHPGELTDEEWNAWADRRPHFEPRKAFWIMVPAAAAAGLNFFLAGVNLALVLDGRGNGWHVFAVVMCALVSLMNWFGAVRYFGAWRNAKIRARCPIPEELQLAFLSLRVQQYLDTGRARRNAWAAVRRQLSRR